MCVETPVAVSPDRPFPEEYPLDVCLREHQRPTSACEITGARGRGFVRAGLVSEVPPVMGSSSRAMIHPQTPETEGHGS